MKEEENLSQRQLRFLEMQLIEKDGKEILTKYVIITLRDIIKAKEILKKPPKADEIAKHLEHELKSHKNWLDEYEKLVGKAEKIGKSREFKQCEFDNLHSSLGPELLQEFRAIVKDD